MLTPNTLPLLKPNQCFQLLQVFMDKNIINLKHLGFLSRLRLMHLPQGKFHGTPRQHLQPQDLFQLLMYQ